MPTWEEFKRRFFKGLKLELLAEIVGATLHHAVLVLIILGGQHLVIFFIEAMVPRTEEWEHFREGLHVADKVFNFCAILGVLGWAAYGYVKGDHHDDEDPPSSPPPPSSPRQVRVDYKVNWKKRSVKIMGVHLLASLAALVAELQFGSQPLATYGTYLAISVGATILFHKNKWHWRNPEIVFDLPKPPSVLPDILGGGVVTGE